MNSARLCVAWVEDRFEYRGRVSVSNAPHKYEWIKNARAALGTVMTYPVSEAAVAGMLFR